MVGICVTLHLFASLCSITTADDGSSINHFATYQYRKQSFNHYTFCFARACLCVPCHSTKTVALRSKGNPVAKISCVRSLTHKSEENLPKLNFLNSIVIGMLLYVFWHFRYIHICFINLSVGCVPLLFPLLPFRCRTPNRHKFEIKLQNVCHL